MSFTFGENSRSLFFKKLYASNLLLFFFFSVTPFEITHSSLRARLYFFTTFILSSSNCMISVNLYSGSHRFFCPPGRLIQGIQEICISGIFIFLFCYVFCVYAENSYLLYLASVNFIFYLTEHSYNNCI